MRELYDQGNSIAHGHASKRFNTVSATHATALPVAATLSKAGTYKLDTVTVTKSKKKKRITSAAVPEYKLIAFGAAPSVEAQAFSSTSSNICTHTSEEYKTFACNSGIVARAFTSTLEAFISSPSNRRYPSGSPTSTPAAHAQPPVSDNTFLKENSVTGLSLVRNFAGYVHTAAETLLMDLRVRIFRGNQIYNGLEEGTLEFVETVTALEVIDVNGEANGLMEGRTVDDEIIDEFQVIHHNSDDEVEEVEDGWSRLV
ncbi:hypothetical protein BC830DRAFT_1172203 [Chytriomyces sp. MP71]|nr:hypothetical protein BC830DRAFT_1172203 [Chytriomyces sp. MP71]